MAETWIIGLDCAVDPRGVGVAVGRLREDELDLLEVVLCSQECLPASTAARFAKGRSGVLFALDAPLGWPWSLGEQLSEHRAGARIAGCPNCLFRRETDRFVKRVTGGQPLDVGADRIARTAHAALEILHEISALLATPIPLAWKVASHAGPRAIEVYPAATLRSHKLPPMGYKKPEQRGNRVTILKGLRERMACECDPELLLRSDHALDASVCMLAGADFLRGECLCPENHETAEKEGWIWVRDPKRPARHGRPMGQGAQAMEPPVV